MRHLFPLLLALLLAMSLAVPSFAAEDDGAASAPDTSSVEVSSSSGDSDASTPSPADPSGSTPADTAPDNPPDTSPDVPDETDASVAADTIKTEEEGVTVNVTIQQAEASPGEDAVQDVPEDLPLVYADGEEDSAYVRTFSVFAVDDFSRLSSPDGDSVLADVVTSVLGEYQRMTYTVTEMDSEGNVLARSTQYVPGLAGLDYEWIAGAALFALFLSGIFKLLGGLMRS